MILTFDPGVNTGWALFDETSLVKQLIACGLLTFDGFALKGIPTNVSPPLSLVIIEKPQVYEASKQKGRQKDIVDTAVRAGVLIGHVQALYGNVPLKTPTPNEWKGNVDKAIHNNRVLARLDERERALLPTTRTSALHNVLDSIGIGLKHLGRM